MSLFDEIKNEQRKMKGKPLKEKIAYIWYYYKVHMLVIVVILVFSLNLISSIVKNNAPVAIYTVVLNADEPFADYSAFMKDFSTYAGIDSDKEQVTLDNSLTINREEGDSMSIVTNQKLMALFSTKTIDVFIGDASNINNYAEVGTFCDLRDLLPEDFQEKYKDRFYYYTYEEDGDIPVGIYIQDFPRIEETGMVSYPAILAVPNLSAQKENAVKFLEYLTNY